MKQKGKVIYKNCRNCGSIIKVCVQYITSNDMKAHLPTYHTCERCKHISLIKDIKDGRTFGIVATVSSIMN